MARPPSLCLLVRDPEFGQSVVPLASGIAVTLGRAPTNRVVLHDERASRFHAEVVPGPQGWLIRDLGSRNGTLLGGEPLTAEAALAPGSIVGIGRAEIVVCEMEHATAAVDRDDAALTRTTGDLPDADAAWRAAITHRRARSRLLDEIRESAGTAPRLGRAAAELCRLAFALGRAADVPDAARLALASAVGVGTAARGVVLLPDPLTDGIDRAAGNAAELSAVAVAPAGAPAGAPQGADAFHLPPGLVAAVLGADEAVLVGTGAAGGAAGISAPIRVRGRPVGILHLEVEPGGRAATADDMEFVMSVCDALGLAVESFATRESLSSRLTRSAEENERLRRLVGEESLLAGASPGMRAIVGLIGRAAATKATVLVHGESGVGKELVARSLHESSGRRSGPFVCMNCAALSETLLESELFGHEKGAFTGATERKAGRFEAADKGTLFLDEIGEMSPAIQAKFLRVLEGHPFERVGGRDRVQVDVRVVAATNRDLEEMVASGQFRRDLYFRLKVVEILVPPLRRRPEDVEALSRHFLRRFAAETGRQVRGFTPAAEAALVAHHWPGNVRELRNCIERAVVLSAGDRIDVADLALSHLAAAGDTGRGAAGSPAAYAPRSLDDVERRHVMATLEAVGGNKTKAAAILGVERSTLDRKLARWAQRE